MAGSWLTCGFPLALSVSQFKVGNRFLFHFLLFKPSFGSLYVDGGTSFRFTGDLSPDFIHTSS